MFRLAFWAAKWKANGGGGEGGWWVSMLTILFFSPVTFFHCMAADLTVKKRKSAPLLPLLTPASALHIVFFICYEFQNPRAAALLCVCVVTLIRRKQTVALLSS